MSSDCTTAQRIVDVRQLEGWLPIDAVVRDGRPGLLWLDMRGVSFDQPFFADTVAWRVKELPPQSEVFTDLDVLLQIESQHEFAPPKGLIIHSSRCGSTALANAIRVLDQKLVFSEPYVVDKLIARLFTDGQDRRKELLYTLLIRAAVGVLGHQKPEADYLIKFSPASGLQLKTLRKIWPDVPWVFLYRDPVEIIVSNLRDLPHWLDHNADPRMAATLAGIEEEDLGTLSSAEYAARLLGKLFRVVAANVSENSMLVNYREFSEEAVIDVIKFFDAEISSAERNRVAVALARYSKDGTGLRPFIPDSKDKQRAATAEIRLASARWATNDYERLEQLRIQQKY